MEKFQLLFPKVQKPVDPEWEMPFHFRQLACFNNYDIAHSAKVQWSELELKLFSFLWS